MQHLSGVNVEDHEHRPDVRKVELLFQIDVIVIGERYVLQHEHHVGERQCCEDAVDRGAGHVLPGQHGDVGDVGESAEQAYGYRHVGVVVVAVRFGDLLQVAAAVQVVVGRVWRRRRRRRRRRHGHGHRVRYVGVGGHLLDDQLFDVSVAQI